MSDKPETIAAILSEMRKAVVPMICGRPKIEAVSIRDVLQWADRIEAAAERERAPGNAAAMRDALNQLRDWALLDINENAIRSDEPNYKKLVDGIVEITNAALAAPARNCDRFKTLDEAREAYWAYREPLELNDKPFVAITEWLFAPAEGGKE